MFQTPTEKGLHMDTGQLAEKVELLLHNKLSEDSSGFDLGVAMLYGVSLGVDGDDETPSLCLINSHPDTYELLEAPNAIVGRMFDYVALVTTGWAAPVGDDGQIDNPPSAHPERKRVRLIVCANRESMASVVRFQENDETHTDRGSATGALADAISKYLS
jgi:hypothetical protein